MRFREHIFDLLAGTDIPVRHALRRHGLNPLILQPLPLTHALHDREGKRWLHTLLHQINHDIIPAAYGRGDRRFPFLYQSLRISQPHIRAVGQPGNTHKICKALGFCINNHLDNKFRAKLRNTQTS